ncbi:MAG: inositol monophosphatase family protein [Gemmatimonadales bacterium]
MTDPARDDREGDELLQAVAEVARLAGAVALGHWRSDLAVEWKGDGSPVTRADREAEQIAREWIGRHYPDDGILGEELGEAAGSSGRRWILDPIDGTNSFVRGVPLWGTLVAVARGEDVLAGAAFFPAVNELLAAAPGAGCWHDGRRSRVSAVASLSEATLLTTAIPEADPPDRLARLLASAGIARTWGDCYGYLLVATGRAEAMVDLRMGDWDSACLLPIIEEAGGVFTDLTGRRTAFGGSAVATNAALAVAVRDALVRPGTIE